MALLIDELEVGTLALRIKFLRTVKVTSITDGNFVLETLDATPAVVSNAFEAIHTEADYNTTSRILVLYYGSGMVSNTSYKLTISGLEDPLGSTIPTEAVEFVSPTITPSTEPPPIDPSGTGDEPIEIVDYSIKGDPITGDILSAPGFSVVSSDPPMDDPIVSTGFNSGRVTLMFSSRPSMTTVNSTNFKAQRKKMQREYSRWEPVPIQLSIDNVKPYVYVDFPSTDTTPVYHTDGHEYFPLDYKYRVRVNGVEATDTVSSTPSQGKLDLVIEQGATFRRTITYLQADGSPRDLTGYTAKMQIKDVIGGTTLYELTTENGRIIIDGPNARISMEILDTVTSGFTWTHGVYDLEISSPEATPTVTRLVQGSVTVTPEVTT
jgi:hypothetical protein